ncbi:uncharacterized protein PV09_07356 [Verruconis gallopava]|uniref:AIG1-type G domain-containing protein n=1 Tax=Verruconis gallopava TaxID=253628 RepID=A0A0D2A4C9_9PEZI|nr:uncharacterized protein PV09_07356 [Verruconis gallopava]KIW01320.1 hypothetical protein PV09_07356 [Verruconis gallopava]
MANTDQTAILLLGATGSGKSSFLASLGLPAKVGHGLQSCTVEPQGMEYTTAHGAKFVLVDTPGFNDTSRSDMEILERIIGFVIAEELRVIAIIYFQTINSRRLTGSSRINLQLLRAIAGEDFYPSVILITSMWNRLAEEEFEFAIHRERDFLESESVWKPLRAKGAAYFRWDERRELTSTYTASEILELHDRYQNASNLHIINELLQGMPLEETTAGNILTSELLKRQEKERQELLAEQEELEELQQQTSVLENIAASNLSKAR